MKCMVQLVRGFCKCCGPRVDPKPVQPRLRRVCSWCSEVQDEGTPGAETTHVMCERCFNATMSALDAAEKAAETAHSK